MRHFMLILVVAVCMNILLCVDTAPSERLQAVRYRRQINGIQKRIIDMFHPKPIVDTMTEDEKYGNEVDHRIGKVVVKTVERLSNAVNSVWNIPVESVKQMSRGATEALNNLGARLVGLEK